MRKAFLIILLSSFAVGQIAVTTTSVGNQGQSVTSQGSGALPLYLDWYHPYHFPAANQNSGTVGTAWSLPTSNPCTTSAKTGTNVLDATYVCTSSQSAQINIALTAWDTGVNPYVRFIVESTDTTNGHTIIPTIQGSCSKGDGTATYDNAFQTAQSGSTVTLSASAVASAPITTSTVQLNSTTMTNCVKGSILYLKLSFSGSGTATDFEYREVVITVPELNLAGAQ